MAVTATASMTPGKAINASITRIKRSSRWRKYPETRPTAAPIRPVSTTVATPMPIEILGPNLDHYIKRVWDLVPFTLMINYAGTPVATLPLHWNYAGLPIGVQVATKYGDKATVFRLSTQLEQARPSFNKRPPA